MCPSCSHASLRRSIDLVTALEVSDLRFTLGSQSFVRHVWRARSVGAWNETYG